MVSETRFFRKGANSWVLWRAICQKVLQGSFGGKNDWKWVQDLRLTLMFLFFACLWFVLGSKVVECNSIVQTYVLVCFVTAKFKKKLRMCYLGFKADLKARKQCHRFQRYYLCKKLCERCDAVQLRSNSHHRMSYKDFSPSAPYLETIMDHDEFMQQAGCVSPWACIPGWQVENCFFDFMHLAYLGTCRSHVPSVLKMLQCLGYCYETGESDELFLKRTSIEMRETCKQNGCLVPKFSFVCLCANYFEPKVQQNQASKSKQKEHNRTAVYVNIWWLY